MAYRIERLERIFEKEIGLILEGCKDQRLRSVTITKVSLTKDISFASVYYTVYDNSRLSEISRILEKAGGFIKSSLGKILEIRKIPELIFKHDGSADYGRRIDEILKGLKL